MKDKEINQYLNDFEKKYNVKILLAVHGGGRQLGVYNRSSDTDVCLIFSPCVKTDSNKKDIMIHGDIDIAGRNIDCLFNGLHKLYTKIQDHEEYSFSELSYACLLFIYIKSPVIRNTKSFIEFALPVLNNILPSACLLNFYLNRSDYNRSRIYDTTDRNKMNICPLLYTMRSIYSAKWVYENGSIPPSDLESLFVIEKNEDVVLVINRMISEYKDMENNQAQIMNDVELLSYFDDLLIEIKKNYKCYPSNIHYNKKEINKIYEYINKEMQR